MTTSFCVHQRVGKKTTRLLSFTQLLLNLKTSQELIELLLNGIEIYYESNMLTTIDESYDDLLAEYNRV